MSENNQATPSSKAPAARFGGKGINVAIVIAAAVAIAGIVLWGIQLTGGLAQTGMRNLDSWGLYITMFMFLVGLSAGGLIISSVPKALGIKGFGGVSKVAVWTSICCTVLAIGFVIVDLGQPLRLWELFAYSNLSSPLMWDIIVLAVYLILSIVYLWATLRAEAGKASQKVLRVISVIALVCAILVHSVTAWIFSLNVGREMWHTALMAPWFVSSALVCGTALVLVVVIALRRAGYMELAQENVVKMAKMLGAFVCVDLYFFACDLLTEGFPGGSGADVVAMLTTGPLAPFFWAEIALSVFAAVVAFVPALRRNGLIVVASLAAVVAIFCKRVQLLVGGFQIPNLDYAGPMSGYTVTDASGTLGQAYQGMVYWPTPLELGIVFGVIGLGALVLLLGLKFLPLRPVSESH
ncbi:NrfD/PsrC family molybdoenzyme membrane anchor subunit [Raoultibacter phocaeensis]|uniref:NrfD/PsrC family molybdoenzyme membrane anchor subunit n=1 Tax=Raoultibacter phocaeensis TaxID=2479841 RepID=UPI001118DD91|nr:NrfD/PsrC family molybdoenzyme membrane anchor subunit [Raoultibacter phocaeensis]